MKAGVVASLFAVATATDLALTWSDCGAKHGTTTSISPSSVPLGAETEMSGTGTVDEDVTGGTYDAHVTAGAGIIDTHFTGNNCEGKTFNLPLNLGTLTWAGLSCPLSAGDAEIKMTVQLSASLPASLATSDINLSATDQNGEDLICVKLHLAKAELDEQGVDCSGAACPSICECANSSCSSQVDACLADSTCSAAQGCVLACACGDTACAAKCAGGAGDAATAVLGCLTQSCGGSEEPEWMRVHGVDCSSAACPSICECANSSCSSQVGACLADSTCAAAQGCVLACACGDIACAAKCAAGAGDAANAVLGCLTQSCGGASAGVSV